MPIKEVPLWAESLDSHQLFLEMKNLFWLSKKPHQMVNVAPLLRPFYVLRSSALAAVRRRTFFYLPKGVKEYESEIYLPQLWDPLGL